jgi:hypothetical protein
MTQNELINKISRLPITQRIEILKATLRLLADELQASSGGSPAQNFVTQEKELAFLFRGKRWWFEEISPSEMVQISGNVEGEVPTDLRLSQRLYGILEFDSGPLTDDEIKDSRADYLMEKYS